MNNVSESKAGAPQAGARERPAYRARIERIEQRAGDTRSLFLRMEGAPFPKYLPGMFISVTIPLASGTRVRPYTIASSPEDGEPFELLLNRVPNGEGAEWMMSREAGEALSFTGPFGTFTLDQAPESEAVFIAEGTAIAPIRPMIRRALALKPTGPLRLLYAADSAEHLFYREEIEAMAAAYRGFDFTVRIAGGSREALHTELIAEVERRWVKADGDRSRRFYVCGIGAGVLRIRDLLRGAGYERRAIRYERW